MTPPTPAPSGLVPSVIVREQRSGGWPRPAQVGDGNPWSVGICWLYCRREGVEVLRVGSINVPGALCDLFACGSCIAELDHMVRLQSSAQDALPPESPTPASIRLS